MIGIPLGLAYSNAGEWLMHKYVLHGSGRSRKSFWSFHWIDHHRDVRLAGMRDAAYEKHVFRWNGQGKEALMLTAATIAHLPLFPIAPFFTATVVYSAINYYRKHKRSHLDPEWAREKLPWHYDHHMAPNQDANWCVTHPFFDHVMGTRIPYVGTQREREDQERATRRRARKEQKDAERAAA